MKSTRGLLLVLLGVVLAMGPVAEPAPVIPPEFQDVYLELYNAISDFRTVIDQSWDGSLWPVVFSADLLPASSHRGPELLAPGYEESIRLELRSLKALGVKAVAVDVGFPMLYRPFHQSEDEYQQYLAFYAQVAQDVRAEGLKLIVKTQVIFTEGSFTEWNLQEFYAGLSPDDYRQGRGDVARTIATVMRPDYLAVIQEPDTESAQTGQPVDSPPASAELLDAILAKLQTAGVEGMAVGAGVGTWQRDYRLYIENFAARPIDFVDMHVYPLQLGFLARAIEIADLARSHGKDVAMSETWLYKGRDFELNVVDFPIVFGRDVFQFWDGLDAYHLQTMVRLAHFKQLTFLSPFWSGYFHGYLPYDDTTKNLTPPELHELAEALHAENVKKGIYTISAYGYLNAIVQPPDTTPPAPPPDLTAHLTSATSLVLTWSPAADNVGTSFYVVFRGSTPVLRTAVPNFSDSGLLDGREYVYSVIAFDVSGNRSPVASVVAETPDVTPPSVPTGVTALPRLNGSQLDIDVTWPPANDNVGVTEYVLYRGTSPEALTPIARIATTGFTVPNAQPLTTYYFSARALDANLNISGFSTPAAVTTPSIPDIVPPVVEVVYPPADSVVFQTAHLYAVSYDLRGGTYDVPSGPAAVQFAIDGQPIGAEQTEPAIVGENYVVFRLIADVASLPEGAHVITAVARDQAGNVATSVGVPIIKAVP